MKPDAPGRLRRALNRLASSDEELEAEELQQECVSSGCQRVADVPDRTRATLRGTLRTVTLRPRGGVPALEAELYDGSGTVAIVWLGRRRIPGIDPGRSIVVRGRVTSFDGTRCMFNPEYELRPGAGE
jgi:hypothetical protein